MARPASPAAPVAPHRIIPVLGMLAAFAPMATDMYLPAFHQMEAWFHVPVGGVEGTLSIFFLGLAAGQAIYGPLIDRVGRRGPLLAGIALYVLATIACLLTDDIGLFTTFRFLQAMGGCAGMIIGRAIIRDLFDARESARALSLLMAVMTLAPILAPILGGFLVSHGPWQLVFYAMLAFGLICAGLVWLFIPETLAPEHRQRHGLGGILKVWAGLVSDRRFIVPALVGGLAQACMFAFITGSPFVFMGLHGASAQAYGGLFALIAAALIVGANLNARLLRHHAPERLLGLALGLNVVAGLATVLAAGSGSLVGLLVPLWFAIGALGFTTANAAAVALAATGRHPGSGSSLIGMAQFGIAFAVSSLVAASQNGTAYPMTVAIAGCGALAFLLWVTVGRRR
ncbi:multidrug effflux MFS transporter [Segnochrobactraceae bacterium EtOH-i3]